MMKFTKKKSQDEAISPIPDTKRNKEIGNGVEPSTLRPHTVAVLDETVSVDHVEKAPPATEPKPKKRTRLRRHCALFKWWYVIGGIIFLAIFLPLLFKVIFPAIVQLIINKQKMPIISGAFQVVSPSQLNVSLETSLNTPIEAKVKPMTLFLYNRETPEFSPFVNLSFPAMKVKGKTILGLTNETRPILNETELSNWFSDVFDAKETALSARGDMKASSGALHFSAKLKKTIKIPGLNKLHGFGIIDMQLVLPPKDDGTNVKGTVNMPNWSVLTLGFGDLALNVLSGDTDMKIGLINVPNVVIPPGNHSFAFTGQIYIKDVLEDIGAVLESQAEALSKGNLKISATGNSTTVNGEHIPFAEKVLNNKRLESEISVIALVSQIFGGLLTEGGNGGPGLLHLIGDIVGNKTLVKEVLQTFNSSGLLDNMSSKGKETRSVLERKPALPIVMELVKMGMKMNSF